MLGLVISLILNVAVSACAAKVLLDLEREKQRITRSIVSSSHIQNPSTEALEKLFYSAIDQRCDSTLLSIRIASGGPSIGEGNNKCQTIADLVRFIATNLEKASVVSLAEAIRGVYYARCTLNLPDQAIKECLNTLRIALIGMHHREKVVADVIFIRCGQRLDDAVMFAWTTGTLVSQPLGAIIEFCDGSRLDKPYVLVR